MPSRSPCYPEPYEWGSPSRPKNARGFYRPLYLAFDAVGHPRVYPATWMQCFVGIIKHDCWTPRDLYAALVALHGSPWAPCLELEYDLSHTLAQAAAGINVYRQPCAAMPGWAWLWTMVFDETTASKWVALQLRIGPPASVMRLDTGVSYSVPGSPWDSLKLWHYYLLASAGDVFGSPWLNPL